MQPETPSRELQRRLTALERIYGIFDEFIASYDLACQHGCAACCTCNMTLTTLEGYYILSGMDRDARATLFQTVRAVSGNKRFQPKTTINTIAQLCRDGKPVPPEDPADPAWGICPLLQDNACPIYPLRPFGCRCMVSKRDCRRTGIADVDELILTVNNSILQYIEHIDQNGALGNLIDVLHYFSTPANLDAYDRQSQFLQTGNLTPNRPVPILMIPPEHRLAVHSILKKLQQIGA